MGRKLVDMTTEARTARAAMVGPRGISGDLDIVAERLFKGKTAKAVTKAGTVLTGKVLCVMNAGFQGIIVHLATKDGRRIVQMADCRVWVTIDPTTDRSKFDAFGNPR